jgi:hypothetical protein
VPDGGDHVAAGNPPRGQGLRGAPCFQALGGPNSLVLRTRAHTNSAQVPQTLLQPVDRQWIAFAGSPAVVHNAHAEQIDAISSQSSLASLSCAILFSLSCAILFKAMLSCRTSCSILVGQRRRLGRAMPLSVDPPAPSLLTSVAALALTLQSCAHACVIRIG